MFSWGRERLADGFDGEIGFLLNAFVLSEQNKNQVWWQGHHLCQWFKEPEILHTLLECNIRGCRMIIWKCLVQFTKVNIKFINTSFPSLQNAIY